MKKNKKIGIIIEARSTSKRLPNKHFYKVKKKTMLEYLLDRAKKIKNVNCIIVATTKNKSDDKICNLSKKKNINFYRGSEHNVTERVLKCAKKFKVDYICEITGDCPIIDIELVDQLISTFITNTKIIDYASHSRGLPNGMDCQIFKTEILEKSFKEIKNNQEEQEHVTLNMRRNSKKYKMFYLTPSKKYYWPKLGITLDEIRDYNLLKKIILYFLNKNKKYFNCLDVIELLKKKKNWIKINQKVRRKDDTIKV